MSMTRFALSVVGALLFVALLVEIGLSAIIASFSDVSWRVLVIVGFPFVLINVFDTLGWKFAFRCAGVPLRASWWARLAGEAFNATTPTVSVGGEQVKAWLIRRHVALDEGLPSVIVAKTTITIPQACFLLAEIAVTWSVLPAASPLLRVMAVLTGSRSSACRALRCRMSSEGSVRHIGGVRDQKKVLWTLLTFKLWRTDHIDLGGSEWVD
jgi:uncharacterized membrane protein YbhN (UPF0104 family)